ncbi:stage VI sporulation protein D [Oceanobacillus sp. J11TS1]|uniref:stage VI sporulation protein D n=1 Tax=Oceanobacillus sp. J11TS1 TaxID=2807191 RepID=UPI001B0CEB79|nr:stage VI sporulation protein D [Oceanobacillus sp. J11TS1]GIO21777.1 hypothetical protein J11TS1_03580 [Oceanobacillus sp. J11TS1]
MSVDSNSLIFELEESLFFEKGQEVEEIRGISIEPEITIQSLDNYISINGAIELLGEYQRVNVDEEEEEIVDFDQIQAKRYVESIREVNGLYVFTHKFPVDISVPPHRVKNLEDVTVQIESFDYDLLGPDSLRITATVEIKGILQDEAFRPVEEQENLETAEANQEQVGDIFSFEIEHPEEVLTRNEEKEKEEEDIEQEQDIEQDKDKEVFEEDPDRWKIKSQSLSEYFQSLSKSEETEKKETDVEECEEVKKKEKKVEQTEEIEDDELSWDVDDESEVIDYIVDTAFPDTPREEEIAMEKEEMEKEELLEEDSDQEKEQSENVSILSEIFREAEQDQYVKMRLCIVQENDTIDTIAERFAVSALQLIKHNQLEADSEVNEGQLLYIPVK